MIKSFKDLEVHKLSYDLAMDFFYKSRKFPKEEIYSLTSHVVRSSRSVSSTITEGWAKRGYENVFKLHLVTALGSCAETENWISFAKDCKYIDNSEYDSFHQKVHATRKRLTKLLQNRKTF